MRACNQGMSPVGLRNLFPEAVFIGSDDYILLDCVTDVLRVNRGDAYVAIRGQKVDGHDLIPEAIKRGAGIIVAERMPENCSLISPQGGVIPLCIVEDSRFAYGKICQTLFRRPGDHLQLVGVTGTSGKTMTACLIAGVLGAAGHGVGMISTLGCFDGVDASYNISETPGPKRLASWLSRMYVNDCSHGVLEFSSMALHQERAAGLDFKSLCLTNVREDHLDYHGTVNEYRKAKMKIFEHMAEDGFAVLNADDVISAEVLNWLGIPALTYGVDESAEITGMIIEQYVSEQIALITAGGETVPLRTRIVGRHHLYNCLAAAAVGLGMGVSLPTIIQGIESVDVVPGRMERLECGQPFSVFVDYALTPDTLFHTLHSLLDVVEGKLICVFGSAGEQDAAKRARMGELVEKFSDVVILTDNNPGKESAERITEEILAGFRDPASVQICHDRVQAIHRALEQAEEGDCVFIAGKGNEKFQKIGDVMHKHDDREVARKWLYKNMVEVKSR
ncbi:MAG: UDP-N-acetylmuramoyl-L-alanyl-D-glutamate--2,6-diaminopimelate ligase [Planctomycetia bacterium]|nr:UDP-N-acetylmuramoyl-L-alanyl-D-glutamate--2,6-diaminopimelate ligase [Planctomycetia bacterium]